MLMIRSRVCLFCPSIHVYKTIHGTSNSTKSKYSCSKSAWYSPTKSSPPALPPDFNFDFELADEGFARRLRYANCV